MLTAFLTNLDLSTLVTESDKTMTYNGALNQAVYKADILAADPGLNGDYLKEAAYRNVGTYQTIYSDDNRGYNINHGKLTINKAALTVTANALNKTYDGTTDGTGGTYSTTGLMGTDTFTGAALAFTNKNAGSGKTLNVSGGTINDGNGGNNYTLTYVANTGSTISPKALTVSFSDADKTYDGSNNAALGTETLSGIVTGDTVSLDHTGMSASYASKNAGTQTVTYTGLALTGTDAGNYTINGTATGTGTINKAALTVTANALNKTYDGTTEGTGGTYSTTGLMGTDTFTGAALAFTDKTAGEGKTLNVSGGTINDGNGGNNYTLTYVANTGSTISPKALTFTPSSAVTKTYDGTTVITGTGTTTGVVAGDVVSTSAVGNFVDKNAGSGKDIVYAITLTGADAGNYTINSTAAGTGTINKAALTVTANALNKTYDGTTEGTGGTYSTTGLMGTDTFTGAALAFTDKNAGSGKTLNVSGGIINDGNGGNNYTITYVSNSGSTIAPKAITVSFSDADKTYDGTQAAAIGAETLSGVVAGDAVSLDRSGMGATYAAKNAGTQSVNYTGIALTGTDAGNYTINSTAVGAGIINRKAVTFVVDEKITKDYDGTTAVHGTGTATGFVSGDDAAVNALGNTADSSAGENKPVTYVFSLLGLDADNYFLTGTTGEGTVTISTEKLEEVSNLAAAIVPKETMVGISEIETMAPQSNTGSGDTVSKDSDKKEEEKQTEEQTDNQVNTQGNEPIRHEFGNDGKLSFTNKGVNPPTSMSAEAVAQQQSQKTAGREEDNQSMDSNNIEGD